MSALMTFREYAETVGVAPSTISRAVSKGKLPAVVLANGRKKIDRAAADSARRMNLSISAGHGGRPDRAVRRQSHWRAQSSTGFDPALRAALNVMRARWPALMQEAMAVLGANQMDAARAVLAVNELVAYLAALTHDEANRSRVWDYRDVLDEVEAVEFEDDAARAFYDRWRDDGIGARWCSDEGGLEGGRELAEKLIEASVAAKP